MRHLISPLDFSVEELDKLMDLANDIGSHPGEIRTCCAGKTLATLFYEPSTRTRLSHEAAMYNLGGNVLGFSSANSSSCRKRRKRFRYTPHDILLCRYLCNGAIQKKVPQLLHANIPVPGYQGGDGGHQHPTQTLTDLLTTVL